MGILIAYGTNYGTAELAARFLADSLGEVTLVNLKKEPNPDISGFGTVVIGGSIRAGKVQPYVKAFVEANEEALLKKRLGLYLCCMYEGDEAKAQFEANFSPSLRWKSRAAGLFGGAIDFQKINFIERMTVKKVAGVKESISTLNRDAMRTFVADLTGQER